VARPGPTGRWVIPRSRERRRPEIGGKLRRDGTRRQIDVRILFFSG
jgi:hypothetical protein